MINAHFKDDGTQTRDPEKYELNESPDENYIAQISRFVSLKTDRDNTPYKKIELFWPHPLLKVMKKLCFYRNLHQKLFDLDRCTKPRREYSFKRMFEQSILKLQLAVISMNCFSLYEYSVRS